MITFSLQSSIAKFVGGKLNQIPDSSNTSLPVDVSEELVAKGAVVCRSVEDLLAALASMADRRGGTGTPWSCT